MSPANTQRGSGQYFREMLLFLMMEVKFCEIFSRFSITYTRFRHEDEENLRSRLRIWLDFKDDELSSFSYLE